MDLDYLYQCNKLSAEIWNLCIELSEKYRKENDGKWMGRNELQKLTKSCVPLHAKGIHHVVHKFLNSRFAILKARKAERRDERYPYRKKKYFVAGWDYQSLNIDYKKGIIELSKPNIGGKRQDPIKCYAKTIPQNIVEIELVYRNKLYLAIKYKEENNYKQIQSNNIASIDLGEIHSITSIDNNGNAIIITGRKLRSIKRLKNKEQAIIFRKMSKCKKGSRKYKRYLRALRNLKVKSDNQILDSVHKITKHYVDYCIMRDIGMVYYGDLDSCVRYTKQDDFGNKNLRQKLSQWCFGQIMLQLQNKLSRYGIKLIKVKEYNTTQQCPKCKNLHKPKGRNYECKCGYRQHRDIVGAINLLNNNTDYHIEEYKTKMYLRIA